MSQRMLSRISICRLTVPPTEQMSHSCREVAPSPSVYLQVVLVSVLLGSVMHDPGECLDSSPGGTVPGGLLWQTRGVSSIVLPASVELVTYPASHRCLLLEFAQP